MQLYPLSVRSIRRGERYEVARTRGYIAYDFSLKLKLKVRAWNVDAFLYNPKSVFFSVIVKPCNIIDQNNVYKVQLDIII